MNISRFNYLCKSVLILLIFKEIPTPQMVSASENIVSESLTCEKLTPIPGFLGYQARDSNKRCEGLYDPLTNRVHAQIIGMTYVAGSQPKDISTVCISKMPARENTIDTDQSILRILGLSILQDTYYRLDGIITDREPILTFRADEVLYPSGMSISQIGFVGRSDDAIVPLVISFDHECSKFPAIKPPIAVALRFATLTNKIAWRWSDACSASTQWTELPSRQYLPGEVIRFDINPPPKSPCGLIIASRNASQNWNDNRWDIK